jgi:hypothetical protein
MPELEATIMSSIVSPEPQNKAATRDATVVSIFPSGRMFCNFVGRQQEVEWAPVSSMPLTFKAYGEVDPILRTVFSRS